MIRLSLPAFLLVLLLSCSRKYTSPAASYDAHKTVFQPDYSSLENWAGHPWKNDPSDSRPLPLAGQPGDSLADVFFIHPTTYTGIRGGWNASVDNQSLNNATDRTTILYQASVFNQHCRVFAPRYRQVHFSGFFDSSQAISNAFDTAYADLRQAFLFYLAHYSGQRPIIIAGHSQGALMTIRLLREFFDGKPLSSRLVAAYIVGWPVTPSSFQSLPVCRDSAQTGCFCSWRTLHKDYVPGYVKKEKETAIVTNPLSWTTGETYAGRELNKGSILHDFNKLITGTTDAIVHNGMLWVNKPRFPGSIFFTTRNYHIGDINLFYMNMRANIETRIFSWLHSHEGL
jgi:pimeloyl-ACP methyl ester carboxylesterase